VIGDATKSLRVNGLAVLTILLLIGYPADFADKLSGRGIGLPWSRSREINLAMLPA
jgi:hypothetical protein